MNNNNNPIQGMLTEQTNQVQVQNPENLLRNQVEFFKTYFKDETMQRQAMETSIAIANDPKLAKCTPESIVKAIMDTVRLGLDASMGINHTWLVPYKNSVQLQISAKGYVQLAYRAGWLIKYSPVYKCDEFSFAITHEGEQMRYVPNYAKHNAKDKQWATNNLDGVIITAVDSKNRRMIEYISIDDIERLRLSSPNQIRAGKYTSERDKERILKKLPVGIWEEWFSEMAIAKAVKKAVKKLPIGDKVILSAIELDDLAEAGKESEYESMSAHLKVNDTSKQNNIIKEKNLNYSNLDELLNLAIMLGFTVTGPFKVGNKHYIQANPVGKDFDVENLFKLGFKKSPHGDYYGMNVSSLVVGVA